MIIFQVKATAQIFFVNYSQDLLEAVVPFDVLLDRRKRSKFLNALGQGLETHRRAKVVQDAGIALASMVICEEALEQEFIISTSYVFAVSFFIFCLQFYEGYVRPQINLYVTIQCICFIVSLANVECSNPHYVFSYVPGMEVTLSSRLKSLYSIYSKVLMQLHSLICLKTFVLDFCSYHQISPYIEFPRKF